MAVYIIVLIKSIAAICEPITCPAIRLASGMHGRHFAARITIKFINFIFGAFVI